MARERKGGGGEGEGEGEGEGGKGGEGKEEVRQQSCLVKFGTRKDRKGVAK